MRSKAQSKAGSFSAQIESSWTHTGLMIMMIGLVTFMACREATGKGVVIWEDQGFKLEAASWVQPRYIQDWTGLQIGLTIPEGGVVTFRQDQNFRLWMPGSKKWVLTKGMAIGDGCAPPAPNSGWDTQNYRRFPVDGTMGCEDKGGRVLILLRLPRMFPTSDSLPTKVEWLEGEYNAAQ